MVYLLKYIPRISSCKIKIIRNEHLLLLLLLSSSSTSNHYYYYVYNYKTGYIPLVLKVHSLLHLGRNKVFVYLQKKIGHFHHFLLMMIWQHNEMESYMTANEYLFAVRNVPCWCYMQLQVPIQIPLESHQYMSHVGPVKTNDNSFLKFHIRHQSLIVFAAILILHHSQQCLPKDMKF